jgi:hypothetical protein
MQTNDIDLLAPDVPNLGMLLVLEEKSKQLSESFANLTGGLQSAMHAVR